MNDRHGNKVALGDVVRVLEICPACLALVADDEIGHITAMLHQEFPIDDLPEENKASVSIRWEAGNELIGYSGLAMLSHEFELVRKAQPLRKEINGS